PSAVPRSSGPHRHLPSFPTRRSSDLTSQPSSVRIGGPPAPMRLPSHSPWRGRMISAWSPQDRRSSENASQIDGGRRWNVTYLPRSEEHTSELQSRENLVCRLLLEKKK